MVTTELIGRLGNQAFQIATTIGLALRNGTNYKIPVKTVDPRVWPTYFNHFPRLYPSDKISLRYKEPEFNYNPIPFTDNMCLSGYFQSEKYFADYRPEIIKAFGIPWKPLKGVVSIHVRRGDYLQFADKHPPVTEEYLCKAIAMFPGWQFMVFSDDMAWCREHFLGPQFTFATKNPPLKDLELMANCEHQIVANSSFSWWGHFFNQNPHKVGIFPKVWFGEGNRHLPTHDIYPPNAIIL